MKSLRRHAGCFIHALHLNTVANGDARFEK